MISINDIINRKHEVYINLVNQMRSAGGYSQLTEKQKIPFRSMQSEILSLEELAKAVSYKSIDDALIALDESIKVCVEKEYYCGAEGLKRVKEWIKSH